MPVVEFNGYMHNIAEVEAIFNGKEKDTSQNQSVPPDAARALLPNLGLRGPRGY